MTGNGCRIRLAFTAEETELHLHFNPEATLFHGTTNIYGKVLYEHGIRIITRKNGRVDFGPGFYLSVGNFRQAIDWARKSATFPTYIKEALDLIGLSYEDYKKIADDLKPLVVCYRIKDIDKWQQLNKREFLVDNIQWKSYVWNWRNANPLPKQDYDWVFGPLADNKLNGHSSEIAAIPSANQLSIHTAKAIELLELVDCVER